MKLNAKTLKALRAEAGYRNQSATPGVIPFPGVARMYQHPVYATRVTTKTCYTRLPMEASVTKVFTRVRRMVVDSRGKAVLEMETPKPGDMGSPGPKLTLVPVTKPARIEQTNAKGIYRSLKRLARKGLLTPLAANQHMLESITNLTNRKEVAA